MVYLAGWRFFGYVKISNRKKEREKETYGVCTEDDTYVL